MFLNSPLTPFGRQSTFDFRPPAVLVLYLFILTLLPMFAFYNISLRFYGHKSVFLLFKLASTCNVIFLYSVVTVYFTSTAGGRKFKLLLAINTSKRSVKNPTKIRTKNNPSIRWSSDVMAAILHKILVTISMTCYTLRRFVFKCSFNCRQLDKFTLHKFHLVRSFNCLKILI
jgi:hypothetical protein